MDCLILGPIASLAGNGGTGILGLREGREPRFEGGKCVHAQSGIAACPEETLSFKAVLSLKFSLPREILNLAAASRPAP